MADKQKLGFHDLKDWAKKGAESVDLDSMK